MTHTVCTVAARDELPQARALAWSLRTRDPTARLLVLLLDDRRHEVDPAAEPFALVHPPSLELERFELLAGMHALPELKRVVQPALLRCAMDRTGQPVLFLGADTLVYGPLDRLFAIAAERRLLLIPRLHAPVPRDHVRLTDVEIAKLGVFDQDCLALAPSMEIDALLRAWSDRLEHDPAFELPLAAGRFLDLAPGFLPDAAIVIDPAVGVSRLNLHERAITCAGDRFAANGRPLLVVHFDGLDGAPGPHPDPYGGPLDGGPGSMDDRAGTPQAARDCAQRAMLARHPGLWRLVHRRDQLVRGCGSAGAGAGDYGYAHLADGTPLSRRLRRAVRDGELHGGLGASPFDAAGTHELLAWLNAPAPRGAAAGVTRYWFEIYRERTDLQMIHPDLDGPGGPGFLQWVLHDGRYEYATPDTLWPVAVAPAAR